MTIGAPPAPPVGYLFTLRDNTPMVTSHPKSRQPASRSKEVETVRIFATTGHPWIAFAALVVWRLPFPALALAAVIYAKHGVF